MDRAAAYADASPVPFWLDDPAAPEPAPPLTGSATADLCVVGGGFTGLWTALLARSLRPDWDVVLLEADRCGGAASGRNGGFCAASLTHGFRNGIERFPDEFATLERMGRANLEAIAGTVEAWSIPCGFERTGELTVATAPHQVEELAADRRMAGHHGLDLEWLDRDAVAAEVASPTFLAGLWDRDGCALLDPARLAWGLREACQALGVRVHEGTAVRRLGAPPGTGPVTVTTDRGKVAAGRVALGTNAFPSPVRRLRKYTVPVYDYVLVTEPLTPEQRAAVGWAHRQGVGSGGNQFLYFRLTADDRILWGGYDAVYHYGSAMAPALERRPATFTRLSTLFAETFPALEEVRFTHAWAGAIDTCTRFCAFVDVAHEGRVASVAGYTGLGVGASRFGAHVMVDLLEGRDNERSRLEFVRSKPVPFPPEPLRWVGIELTRRAMARADADGGRRGAWLRLLDRVGMGFDS